MGRIVFEGERRWSRRRGIVVTATLVVVLGVVASVLKFRSGGEAIAQDGAAAGPGAMPPMPVDVDTARQRPVVDAVRATGRIEAVQAVELRPDELGRITALLFREGQYVARGAPLIKIDDE